MHAQPANPSGQKDSRTFFRTFSSARVVTMAGVLGLGVGVTAPACIASRYNGGPGGQDGAVSDAAAFDAASGDAAGFDAAGFDAASFDAAQTDSARDQSAADASTPDAAAVDGSTPPADLSVASDDPFDPGSCSGPPVSTAQALALLGAASRVKLADATLYARSRTCSPPGTCGAWSTPVVHKQSLLTYSGGVTTDYKTFTFPTHLIVFPQAGQPRFVIRHESDYRHDATANTRGVGFALGADPMENTYPVINVWDFAPAPSRYEDLAGRLGDKGQLHVAEHCARVVFPTGTTLEVAALYKF